MEMICFFKQLHTEDGDGEDLCLDVGSGPLISLFKLMEEQVRERIIDTLLPLTCLPIKRISFPQFIS